MIVMAAVIANNLTTLRAAMPFRRKATAALLAFLVGAFGAHRLYLGAGRWWLPLGVTVAMIPLLLGVENWYRSPAFFLLMVPVAAGFIEALRLALMPDEKFDALYNPGSDRRNASGWAPVLVAIATLMVGAVTVLTTLALLFQTIFE